MPLMRALEQAVMPKIATANSKQNAWNAGRAAA
jgi:hypothetical protein